MCFFEGIYINNPNGTPKIGIGTYTPTAPIEIEQANPTIVLKSTDTTVAKEGDEISEKLAETLKRLDIKPMEVGLDLVAAWEEGYIFEGRDLRIDEEEYSNNFVQAAQWAFNLAVESAYMCQETSEVLVQKAFREAKSVALEGNILSPDTTDEVVAKAERQAQSVKNEANL